MGRLNHKNNIKADDYKGTVLVVDDDKHVRMTTSEILNDSGFKVIAAEDGKQALSQLNDITPDIILLDIMMPGINGMEVLKNIKEKGIPCPVIMMTGYADISTAVHAIKLGAYEFLTKPFDAHMLINVVNNAIMQGAKSREAKMSMYDDKSLYELMGNSDVIQTIVQNVNQVAKTDYTVFIKGETGTGKELIANAIHKQSKRHDKPFIVVDCGAVSDALIESEFFGHKKGAFTGAHCDKEGYFALANNGTLFLDEISNLSLSSQAKFLRALEEQRIHPVGSEKHIDIDVRVVAASNLNLDTDKSFRIDLFHRLNEFSISVPALRERRDDIFSLAERFLKDISNELNKDCPKLSSEAIECLLNYDWPGNVRELINTIKKAALTAEAIIKPEHLDIKPICCGTKNNDESDACMDLKSISSDTSSDVEKLTIHKALEMSNGNKSKAAKLLNINYKTLYNKIKQYKMEIK